MTAEFQKLWRSIPVDSIDEEKIEEYLNKQGISSMQETGPKKVSSVPYVVLEGKGFQLSSLVTELCSVHQLPVQKRKKQGAQRKRHFKTHNNHLAGILEDYSDGVPVKK